MGGIDITGHSELEDVNVSGILTATSADITGNLVVGGTLSYDNVTTVESIGIITAQSGVRITGGGLDVVGVSTFNNDLDIDASVDISTNLNVAGISTFQDDVNIAVGGTTAFFAVSAYRVGINSTIPEHTLDVDGSINSSTDVKIDGVSVLTTASDEAIALAIALG